MEDKGYLFFSLSSLLQDKKEKDVDILGKRRKTSQAGQSEDVSSCGPLYSFICPLIQSKCTPLIMGQSTTSSLPPNLDLLYPL